MSYYVYILYSERIDKYYVGKTENLESHLSFHNSERNGIWTKRGQPWEMVKFISFESSTLSSKAERFIKRQKSRKLLEEIIKNGWVG
jgi:putative endonuclease